MCDNYNNIIKQLDNFKEIDKNLYLLSCDLSEYEYNEIFEYIYSKYDKKNFDNPCDFIYFISSINNNLKSYSYSYNFPLY